MHWLTLAVFIFVMLLVDLMFGDDSQFNFDPDYHNWRRKTDALY